MSCCDPSKPWPVGGKKKAGRCPSSLVGSSPGLFYVPRPVVIRTPRRSLYRPPLPRVHIEQARALSASFSARKELKVTHSCLREGIEHVCYEGRGETRRGAE
jgi:hypothetical protein